MFEGLTADGFDDCVVGIGQQFNTDVVVYNRDKIIKKLAKEFKASAKESFPFDGEKRDFYLEAEEYFDFNIAGAYVGVNTPVYIRLGKLDDLLSEE